MSWRRHAHCGFREWLFTAVLQQVEYIRDGLHPDAAYDQRLFYDAPFLNELCIVFLVALRHHIERRLTLFAACAADAGRPITRQEFSARMKELPDLVSARIVRSSKRYDTLPMPTSTTPDAGD